MYRDLRKRGAYDPKDGLGRQRDFFWLWRSNLRNYDQHARVWQKWLCQLLSDWRGWPKPTGYWDGFQEYDAWVGAELEQKEPPIKNDRWRQFCGLCDGLVSALGRATLAPATTS